MNDLDGSESTQQTGNVSPNAKFVMTNPIHLLAFGFGSGLSPKAPGTFGTLAALPIWFLLIHVFNQSQLLVLIVLSFFAGIWICKKSSEALGVHDHGGIVWDEFVGLWLTLWLLPNTLAGLLVGFVCFRLFDILKPWPIRWLDKKVHGGLGIMLDDAVAALPAAGLALGLLFLLGG